MKTSIFHNLINKINDKKLVNLIMREKPNADAKPTNVNKQKYDVWLNWSPIAKCNLDCIYCIAAGDRTGKVKKINIPALIKTLDKTDKIFRINFTGNGEPFLIPNFIEVCQKLTEKHYISMNTNLTSTKVKELAEKVNPSRVTNILASTHIKELEKHDLLNTYIQNFLLLKQKGFIVTAHEIAYPPLISEVKKYTDFFKDKGIDLNFAPFIGQYQNKKYPDSYTDGELELFGFKKEKGNDPKKYKQFTKFCNAGYNAFEVDMNGQVYRCSAIRHKYGNVYKKIKFDKTIINCPVKFCPCPLKEFDKGLFKQALMENNIEQHD